MLKPAQLYKEELNKKILEKWYTDDLAYYTGWHGESIADLPDNNATRHDFVSVDHGNVIGYISYNIDYVSLSARDWGAINFDKGNLTFAKDLFQAIEDVFYKYNMHRMEWCCIADNPIIHSYRTFIRLHGGRECGYFRQCAVLPDGLWHDSVQFEILETEFSLTPIPEDEHIQPKCGEWVEADKILPLNQGRYFVSDGKNPWIDVDNYDPDSHEFIHASGYHIGDVDIDVKYWTPYLKLPQGDIECKKIHTAKNEAN